MTVFQDNKIVEELFGDLWGKMLTETPFGKKIKEGGISIYYIIDNPDFNMYIDTDGVIFGEEARKKNPVITMKMSGDTVHKFWLKKLNLPKALALRHIKTKGPLPKVMQLLPLLRPGQEIYPEYCKKYGLDLN